MRKQQETEQPATDPLPRVSEPRDEERQSNRPVMVWQLVEDETPYICRGMD